MQYNALNRFNNIVAIGGGHGLGRVLSTLSFLGPKLTGIVATTDNGGSTGRLREQQECIAWGDLRNCLSQLASNPSIGSLLFEYRFAGESDLSGHNLGNIILLALDQLCVRPLEAVNVIRQFLNIDTRVIPMSEEPTHLVAIEACGNKIFGETNVDGMLNHPMALSLEPMVTATCEACDAVREADLVILGPGSFLTSIMPPLLLPKFATALAESRAEVILIDNLTREPSSSADFTLEQRIDWCHQVLGVKIIDRVLCHSDRSYQSGNIVYRPLVSQHHKGLHDKKALADALASIVSEQETQSFKLG
ncbi:uridine diphosphate-N-acetylglucosamine-binding protein YvcK [Shewanella sp. D64]|uniref:uridine diphosphate-N-acetylglucosamine-binding protein YvcK n=1 Tax=unclassified Shewanella TaxID=196818 RepID=UPI0022BA2994|nr:MULTISPECIES: uridine diphosphate-N-acetylglucosamine-binding protein YvcK [unclassified Shewanella]MEC4724027.1 uridine diphosphate-N-acetylglucosamine-binding protein YvcK [Shewanella sp. D64]MEC4736047.1 uridine diphosphate-N-acetylglucosamine-binding protein YvcK [Shewanella sp. E94]WBJ98008.1 uridine diphosphate-N-acetylglucosamine-binding protein YvcK [Shewanella sp. MTB7]